MGWLSTLNESYDNIIEFRKKNPKVDINIVPPGIARMRATLTVVINEDSEFVRADFIDKANSTTNVFLKGNSAMRVAKETPHALFDQISYVAGDLKKYVANPKDVEGNFIKYIEGLSSWADIMGNKKINIILNYLTKETLVEDLISFGSLKLDQSNYIDQNVKHNSVSQEKYFIRFALEMDGNVVDLWDDAELISEHSNLFLEEENVNLQDFCYATGNTGAMARLHGKYIRYPGDAAKLISSNDETNYTFRGRGNTPDKVVRISKNASEKAHSALRWLIGNQGYNRNGYTVVAWNVSNDEIIPPLMDTDGLAEYLGFGEILDTGEVFSKNLGKALSGYRNKIDKKKPINIMAMDAATQGRMSILYYSEKDATDYIDAIEQWHSELAWPHFYKRKKVEKDGKEVSVVHEFIGAPAPIDIIICAFGTEQGDFMKIGEKDKFVNQQLRRILPSIVDKAKLPVDFMRGAYRNAIRPQSKNKYNWRMCTSVACSLIRKYYIDRKRVDYNMTLNKELADRSYLYGRLLAIADKVESDALRAKKIERDTTAMRYMESLSKRPYRTWKNIELSLNPYWRMISQGSAVYYKKLLNEVMNLFTIEDFKNNRQLEPIFLLGYHSQTADFYKKNENTEGETENDK